MNWRTVLDSFFSAFNQFRTISFIDIIDILIVAYIIYRIMKLLKDTSAERLIKGIIILVGIMLLASMLHLTMISWLLQQALNVGLFAIVVVFQPELRRLLEQIGKGNFSRLIVPADAPDEVESMITATVSACADMSRTKTGALIVFERRERLGEIISTGTMVDAAPSAELIKNIFFKNSPLHDGARARTACSWSSPRRPARSRSPSAACSSAICPLICCASCSKTSCSTAKSRKRADLPRFVICGREAQANEEHSEEA